MSTRPGHVGKGEGLTCFQLEGVHILGVHPQQAAALLQGGQKVVGKSRERTAAAIVRVAVPRTRKYVTGKGKKGLRLNQKVRVVKEKLTVCVCVCVCVWYVVRKRGIEHISKKPTGRPIVRPPPHRPPTHLRVR